MNFLSHGSQDLFPTYLQKTKGFSAHAATISTIIGNCVRSLSFFVLFISLFSLLFSTSRPRSPQNTQDHPVSGVPGAPQSAFSRAAGRIGLAGCRVPSDAA